MPAAAGSLSGTKSIVVRDVHRVGVRREVVDHVVHDPAVARVVVVPEALGHGEDRLLLAGGERRVDRSATRDEPDAVVQVDDVDPRRVVAALLVDLGVDQVGLEARDVAGDLRLLGVGLRLDRVLPRGDLDRPVEVGQALHARIGRLGNGLDRRDVGAGQLRRGGGGAAQRGQREQGDQRGQGADRGRQAGLHGTGTGPWMRPELAPGGSASAGARVTAACLVAGRLAPANTHVFNAT